MNREELRDKWEEIEYPWGRGRDGNARPFRGEGQIHEKLDALMEYITTEEPYDCGTPLTKEDIEEMIGIIEDSGLKNSVEEKLKKMIE